MHLIWFCLMFFCMMYETFGCDVWGDLMWKILVCYGMILGDECCWNARCRLIWRCIICFEPKLPNVSLCDVVWCPRTWCTVTLMWYQFGSWKCYTNFNPQWRLAWHVTNNPTSWRRKYQANVLSDDIFQWWFVWCIWLDFWCAFMRCDVNWRDKTW